MKINESGEGSTVVFTPDHEVVGKVKAFAAMLKRCGRPEMAIEILQAELQGEPYSVNLFWVQEQAWRSRNESH